jgi:hypothetical protein
VTFWYYKDKKLIGITESETLTQADKVFQEQSGQDPKKNGITVTLEMVTDYDNSFYYTHFYT